MDRDLHLPRTVGRGMMDEDREKGVLSSGRRYFRGGTGGEKRSGLLREPRRCARNRGLRNGRDGLELMLSSLALGTMERGLVNVGCVRIRLV